jgi:hypothetical protein
VLAPRVGLVELVAELGEVAVVLIGRPVELRDLPHGVADLLESVDALGVGEGRLLGLTLTTLVFGAHALFSLGVW